MMLEQGKIMKLRGVILLVSTIAVICMGHEATAAPGPAIVYTMKTVERLDPRCSRGASDCPVYIRFRYPVIVRAPSPVSARAITRAINDFLLTGDGPTELLLTYREIKDLLKPDGPLGRMGE